MARVEMADGWEASVLEGWRKLADERLGPGIAADAARYAPVGQTVVADPAHPRTPPHEAGELKASIDHHLEGDTLVIDSDASYAADVELGTRPHDIDAHGPWSLRSGVTGEYFGSHVHHPGTRPESYFRAALFQPRGE